MASNHVEISKKIYKVLKQSENECDNCEDADCLDCFIKKYLCDCGIITTKHCHYCKKQVCDNCENIDNDFSVCNTCFKVYY